MKGTLFSERKLQWSIMERHEPVCCKWSQTEPLPTTNANCETEPHSGFVVYLGPNFVVEILFLRVFATTASFSHTPAVFVRRVARGAWRACVCVCERTCAKMYVCLFVRVCVEIRSGSLFGCVSNLKRPPTSWSHFSGKKISTKEFSFSFVAWVSFLCFQFWANSLNNPLEAFFLVNIFLNTAETRNSGKSLVGWRWHAQNYTRWCTNQ